MTSAMSMIFVILTAQVSFVFFVFFRFVFMFFWWSMFFHMFKTSFIIFTFLTNTCSFFFNIIHRLFSFVKANNSASSCVTRCSVVGVEALPPVASGTAWINVVVDKMNNIVIKIYFIFMCIYMYIYICEEITMYVLLLVL